MTERLWLTEPRRKTALSDVVEVRGDLFRLDRSLYCPKSHAYRHPQLADRGIVWRPSGEKRNVATVFEQGGLLWHRLEGTTPERGERLQCHLDVDRRRLVERAHTAMHILIHTLPRGLGAFTAHPNVQGGGHIRLTFDGAPVRPDVLAEWRKAAVVQIHADRPVTRIHVSDAEVAHRLKPQPFVDAPFPGPAETKEAIEITGLGALPCDGTHAERTGPVEDLVLVERHAAPGQSALVWRIG